LTIPGDQPDTESLVFSLLGCGRPESRLPMLWSRSYFASAHGRVSSETIKKYVEEKES
jgi:REP element-mobilizing transposase RayT